MAHVFIVDDKTFPVHLQFAFAGTGAKDYTCDFIQDSNTSFHSSRERLLTGMCADISRIRPGDDILFYLQQSRYHEGMFFGSFKAESTPFICSGAYLKDALGKRLIYRVNLTADKVLPLGATERECLDDLDGITHPSQMCWSLIYRKLKGNRGCTMITDFEYAKIMSKIAAKNTSRIERPSYCLSFDPVSVNIFQTDFRATYRHDSDMAIDILPRLIHKAKAHNAFETHLQAYILKNLESISPVLVDSKAKVSWIGNEVSCGVGMQSIDLMFMQETEDECHIAICEIKDEQVEPYISAQISKYIKWVSDFLTPTINKAVSLHPIIIAPKPTNEKIHLISDISQKIIHPEPAKVKPLKYIGFQIGDRDINFEEFPYAECCRKDSQTPRYAT